ncbi:MAG: hypothetical protein ACREFE_07410 [Limisphaerales bacterium]
MTEQKIRAHGKIMKTLATPQMVEERARELAVIAGRGRHHVMDSDRAQAQRELLGDESADNPADEPNIVGSGMGAPPASRGRRIKRHLPTDDEDEIRTVQEGVNEAEHNEMLEAGKTETKSEG